MVVAFHAIGSRLAGGLNAGVTIFFVLSGFLLYRPFVAARFGVAPAVNVRHYFTRRALRILPAWWAAVLIIGLVDGAPAGHIATDLALIQTFSSQTVFAVIPAGWSLSVEAMFYVALPLYALGAARALRRVEPAQRARAEQRWLVGAALAAIALKGALFELTGVSVVVYASLPGTVLWFLVGMAGAVESVRREASLPGALPRAGFAPALLWAAAAGGLALITARAGGPAPFDPGSPPPSSLTDQLVTYVLAAGVAAGVAGLLLPRSRALTAPSRLARAAPVAALGLISYGIYLWHEAFLDWTAPLPVARVLGVSGCVLAAAISYQVVEKPALRRKPGVAGTSAASRRFRR
jgi:peptidoglycan/LPS O-acetylase OafA/YrhL